MPLQSSLDNTRVLIIHQIRDIWKRKRLSIYLGVLDKINTSFCVSFVTLLTFLCMWPCWAFLTLCYGHWSLPSAIQCVFRTKCFGHLSHFQSISSATSLVNLCRELTKAKNKFSVFDKLCWKYLRLQPPWNKKKSGSGNESQGDEVTLGILLCNIEST